MPEATEPAGRGTIRRYAPEIVLALLAATVFLGRLGAMELWGKREQRAVAEALDTLDGPNWLVAHIQSRPRLEKPPLPRWTIASLMAATGVRSEALARFPSAFTALAMVGLVYGLGRRVAGRSAGLASGLILASMFFFVVESRQAGNDGPLAFFVTLAIYAAFRRLHGVPADEPPGVPGDRLGARGWTLLMWAAMGLGFLSKGPVVVLLVALAVVPYLVAARRFKAGGRALLSASGIASFLVLSLSWPVLVLLNDPNAASIWWLEIGQKAGTVGITHHKQRWIISDWPWMTAPWTLLATWGLVAPFVGRGRTHRPASLLAWWWAAANLAMLSLWSVAKPNYYVPCEPAVALLAGLAWVDVIAVARDAASRASGRARRAIQLHWLMLGAAAVAAPAAIWAAERSSPLLRDRLAPEVASVILGPVVFASVALLAGVAVSVWAWRRRHDRGVMGGMVGGIAVAMTIAYSAIVPEFNAGKSHRVLAAQLDAALPRKVRTVMFFRELDEGLWFYLKDRTLAPVPGSPPRYSKSWELQEAVENNTIEYDDAKRIQAERQILVDWLDGDEHESAYVLIRAKSFDLFSPGIAERAEPVFRETGVDRNKLMLLKLRPQAEIAAARATETARGLSPQRR